jgi:hypothetical protein
VACFKVQWVEEARGHRGTRCGWEMANRRGGEGVMTRGVEGLWWEAVVGHHVMSPHDVES